MIEEICINEIKERWFRFVKKRSTNLYFDHEDPDYITALEREEIITMLFDYIEENDA